MIKQSVLPWATAPRIKTCGILCFHSCSWVHGTFLITLCFSSLTASGNVAAWSMSCQCSHDIQHVGSDSSREAMPWRMEMQTYCWLSPMCAGKRGKLAQHVSWQELSITAPLPSPVTDPVAFVTSSSLAHVQRKNFTWRTALSLQFLDTALKRNFLALVILWHKRNTQFYLNYPWTFKN